MPAVAATHPTDPDGLGSPYQTDLHAISPRGTGCDASPPLSIDTSTESYNAEECRSGVTCSTAPIGRVALRVRNELTRLVSASPQLVVATRGASDRLPLRRRVEPMQKSQAGMPAAFKRLSLRETSRELVADLVPLSRKAAARRAAASA